jgi:hypothetical protein
MKALLIAISALLVAGCESSRINTRITAEQAGTLSVQLANDKAETVYHRRPFEDKQPAQFEDGRWIWRSSQGMGTLDFQATVELPANGSTNRVDVRLTDDALHQLRFDPNEGAHPQPLPPYFQK